MTDRLTVTYRIDVAPADGRARAEALAVEQSVEMPLSALVHAALHEGRIINDLEQLFADRPLKAELE